jgi:hypothetical protein
MQHHPPRPKTWEYCIRREWLCQNHRLWSRPQTQIEQLWGNEWNSWLHVPRSHLPNEPFLRSRLFCPRSHNLLTYFWNCKHWGYLETIFRRLSKRNSRENTRSSSKNKRKRPPTRLEFHLRRFCEPVIKKKQIKSTRI